MPELPEVECVIRGLKPLLCGKCITGVQVLHRPTVEGSPAGLVGAQGHRIEALRRIGKYILVDLDSDCCLAIHLRMTGWLGIVSGMKREEPRKRRNKRLVLPELRSAHLRVVFELDGGRAYLTFRDARTFGRVWFGSREKLCKLRALAKLGPDALGLDCATFIERIRGHSGALKPLLLNQEVLAGIGNIYADEALFESHLHPLAHASRLTHAQALRLHAAIQRILNAAIRAGGTSVSDYLHPDGKPGWFQRKLKVYGRDGEACFACGAIIQRIVIGQRGSWFCPKCQKKT
jgi:formamidopyrimidine-DNA glycosylase